jgi:hypothetical protein
MDDGDVNLPPVQYQGEEDGGDPNAAMVDEYDVGDEINPFKLPTEDVFQLRDREKKEKHEKREREKNLKIWEKGPGKSSRLGIIKSGGASAKFANPKADRMFQGRRREKENMADFVAKKRDMFLIQMSLDTKRQEIQKLEEKAQMKEDALRKSEMMLEEDAMRFDAFLKENDRKAHDALKRADMETKEKQEKVIEIKKLNQEINKVDNEMSKYEEQLTACLKYKKFLDNLTPPEHLAAVEDRKKKAKKAKHDHKKAQNPNVDLNMDDISSDEDEDEMYFKRPEQLLEIFAQLEERNLFLIQNVQETEEALEELKQKMKDTEQTMKEKTQQLDLNIQGLNEKIKIEQDKAEQYRRRTSANTTTGNLVKLLAALSEKVREVYRKCDFDGGEQMMTLDMLREIEGRLESLLNEIKGLEEKKVREAEKKKENERRNRVRRKKKEEQKKQYEERLAKSTARAKAEVIRQTGKQLMFRSPPVRKKKKKEENEKKNDDDAEDVKKFFT